MLLSVPNFERTEVHSLGQRPPPRPEAQQPSAEHYVRSEGTHLFSFKDGVGMNFFFACCAYVL